MLGVTPVGAAPTGTIGVGGVEVLVESEPDGGVADGGFWPLGITMGVGLAPPPPLPPLSPPLSLPESEFSCGGQSTDVGGQLSVLPDPDDEPGGGQPAWAMLTGSNATHAASDKAPAAIQIREVPTASGCPRGR